MVDQAQQIQQDDPYRGIKVWLESGATSLSDFNAVVEKWAPEDVLKEEFNKRLGMFFANEKSKLKLWQDYFLILDQSTSLDEFTLYAEYFIKILAEQTAQMYAVNHAKECDPENQAKLIGVFLAYDKKHLDKGDLTTLDEQDRKVIKSAFVASLGAVATPMAGLAGAIISPLAKTAVQAVQAINNAHTLASSAGLTQESKKTFWQKLSDGAKSIWSSIKQRITAAVAWVKANPVKAIVGGLLIGGGIAASILFFPLPIVALVGGAVIAAVKIGAMAYARHVMTQDALKRVQAVDAIIDGLQGANQPAGDHAHKPSLSSTAVADKEMHMDEHQVQEQLAAMRGTQHLENQARRIEEEAGIAPAVTPAPSTVAESPLPTHDDASAKPGLKK
jgi:hypothetical protein